MRFHAAMFAGVLALAAGVATAADATRIHRVELDEQPTR